MRSHIDLAQGDLLASPAAPRERRLTTRQLREIQEATEAASCAAAATRKATPYCSLSFAWNGSGYPPTRIDSSDLLPELTCCLT